MSMSKHRAPGRGLLAAARLRRRRRPVLPPAPAPCPPSLDRPWIPPRTSRPPRFTRARVTQPACTSFLSWEWPVRHPQRVSHGALRTVSHRWGSAVGRRPAHIVPLLGSPLVGAGPADRITLCAGPTATRACRLRPLPAWRSHTRSRLGARASTTRLTSRPRSPCRPQRPGGPSGRRDARPGFTRGRPGRSIRCRPRR